MTGRELTEWISDNGAEDMEILFLQDDGKIMRVIPELMDAKEMKEEYWDAEFLSDEGKCVLL